MNNLQEFGAPLLADLPDYQAVFLHEIVRGLAELLDYTHGLAGNIDRDTLHGLTTRIEALRDDLGDELPSDPRVLPAGEKIIGFPRRRH